MMATAFLGYDYSPIWYELNLNFAYFSLFSLLFTLSFILFYLDNFNLSDNFLIKFIQVISFISILFICVLSIYNNITPSDFICNVGDMNNEIGTKINNVNLQGHDKEAMFFIATVNINRCKFSTFQPFYKQLNYSSTLCNNLLDTFLKKNKLKPVYFYENLHLDNMRKTILEDTKNLSGVYLIFNKITGDYYIGSAATNRFYARFSNHLLYFRGSKIIKHAVKKYGLSNFAFLVLELFPFIVNKENNKNLLDMEDYYLKSLLPNYNILTEAGSSFGYKHTEIDRIKMKLNYSIERRERIGKLNRNKKLSLETIEKIRDKALSKKKIFYSDEALLNMKKKSKPVILYNLNNTVFGEYPSIVEAAKSINCDPKTIRRALKTDKQILKRRFIVKYKEYK